MIPKALVGSIIAGICCQLGTLGWFHAGDYAVNSISYLLKNEIAAPENHSLQHTRMLGPDHTRLISYVYPRRKSRVTPEIVASILEVCLEYSKKTKIMYTANLTTRSLHKYLESLVQLGLLEKSESYHTTEKGRIYLELFNGIEILLRERNVARPLRLEAV